MKIRQNALLSTIFLIVTGAQAIFSLIDLMAVPSEENNAFILGYSFSRLVIAFFFLAIVLCCAGFLIANRSQKPIFYSMINALIDHPQKFFLIFIGLLTIILSSSILIALTDKLNNNNIMSRYSYISIESLYILIAPLFTDLKLYLLKLIPLFKWFLAFGINSVFYLFWSFARKKRVFSNSSPKGYLEVVLGIISIVLCLLLTGLIYFPDGLSLMIRIDTLYDWLLVFTLAVCLGLLITLVYYTKKAAGYFFWGLLIVGLIFNLIDHVYNSSRLELARKPSNSLESYFLTPNKYYHFREYPVYQKLSRDYAGKELKINNELMDELSLSPTRLIAFGRLAKVTSTQDKIILDDETAQQLLESPYTKISTLNKYRTKRHEWIFIEENLENFDCIQVKKYINNMIFVYPIDNHTGALGEIQ